MTSPLILITRPARQAAEFAGALGPFGCESFVEPVLRIETLQDAPLPASKSFDALLFTSANGVRAFSSLRKARGIKVFAVGTTTAQAAAEARFAEVVAADGDIAALENCLADQPAGMNILYPSGIHISRMPSSDKHKIVRVPVYEAQAVQTLGAPCLECIDSGAFTAVTFFSARTAEIFTALIGKYGRTDKISSIKALCISDSVVNSLKKEWWQDVRIARTPDPAGMIELVRDVSEKD